MRKVQQSLEGCLFSHACVLVLQLNDGKSVHGTSVVHHQNGKCYLESLQVAQKTEELTQKITAALDQEREQMKNKLDASSNTITQKITDIAGDQARLQR